MKDSTLKPNFRNFATDPPVGAPASEIAPHADWTSMKRTDHFVQIYESGNFLVRSVAEYVIHGLRTGATCIVVATPEHRKEISKLVAQFGLELNSNDKYIELDARETLNKFAGKKLDKKLFDKTIGSLIRDAEKLGPVRVFGEMVALLLADGKASDALKLEDMWNSLQKSRTFSLFCAYPTDELTRHGSDDFIAKLCSGHSKVIPDETYTSLLSEDRLKQITLLQQRNRQLEAELAALRS